MTANDSTFEQANEYITGTFCFLASTIFLKPPSLEFDLNRQSSLCKHEAAALRPHLPITKGFSEERIYDTYAAYVERHGSQQAKDALRNGRQVIVGLRIETNTRANQGRGLYDDRIAVIWQETPNSRPVVPPGCIPRGQHGQQPPPNQMHRMQHQAGARNSNQAAIKHGADFTANTEPSAYYEQPTTHLKQIKSKKTGKMIQVRVADKIIDPNGKEVISHPHKKWYGEDKNNDGRRDLGRLVPGTYKFYNTGKKFHSAVFLHQKGSQTVERDINHDGLFTPDDIWHTDNGDMVIETGSNFNMYIHKGRSDRTSSAGCQTLPANEHARFFRTLVRQNEYYYVLVTLK